MFSLNIFFELGLMAAGLIFFWRCLNRPATILCALACAVSFIAVNINIGFTIYISRLLLLVLLLVIVLRGILPVRGGLRLRLNPIFFILFAATICVQSLTLPIAENEYAVAHARIMFIYLSMMANFIAVLILGVSPKVVVKALRFYLAFGIVQGLVGIYQVIGGMKGWPMYQDFVYGSVMDTIRTGNPRNLLGIYGSEQGIPRAFGFLSDVNHYGGYIVGVILLALAFIVYNRRDILAYMALFAGGAGLVLSLSRSAWLTLIVFGLPVLIFVLIRSGFSLRWLRRPIIAMIVVLFVAAFIAAQAGLFDIKEVILNRVVTFVSGESSAEAHMNTRLLALDAWKSSPLIGVGLACHTFGWYSSRYDALYVGAHSHHFDVLAGTGILGLALEWTFMAVVFLSTWRGLKQSRRGSQERVVLAGLIAAYVAIFFGNFLYHYYMYDFVWFLMGCGVALSREICHTCPPSSSFAQIKADDALKSDTQFGS